MDRDRLAKILSLSQSDNDHEALSALRQANSMLKKANMSWQQVLSGASSYEPPRRPQKQQQEDPFKGFDWQSELKKQMDEMFRQQAREKEAEDVAKKWQQAAGSKSARTARMRQMIEECMSQGSTTPRMLEILEKIKRGTDPTNVEEQYIEAIHAVVYIKRR